MFNPAKVAHHIPALIAAAPVSPVAAGALVLIGISAAYYLFAKD